MKPETNTQWTTEHVGLALRHDVDLTVLRRHLAALPLNRELSLALAKIDEAHHWLHAAIEEGQR